MKRIKKIAALFLAVVMVMAMGLTAMADETNKAKITINNAAIGESYTVYKLFDVSVAKTDKEDSNKITAATYYLSAADYGTYGTALEAAGVSFTKSADNSRYTVSKINNKELKDLTSNDMASWATTLNEKLSERNEDGTPKYSFNKIKTDTATEKMETVGEEQKGTGEANPVVFDNLAAGYYFVDSTLGSLCSLDTSADSAMIYEKNSIPGITKEVLEDSTSEWGDEATADITQNVQFRLTVNTGTNSNATGTGVDDEYVITDILPNGMSYVYEAETGVKGGLSVSVKGENSVPFNLVKEATYTGKTLVIKLEGTAVAGLGQDKDIEIEYTASVDSSAVIGSDGNTNNVTLTYKEQSSTDSATVKTYEIGADDDGGKGTITKVDATDENAPLAGVGFTLTDASGRYAKVAADKVTFDGWAPADGNAVEILTDTEGEIHVKGLDAGKYILTETSPLPGYNALDYTITVTIAEDGTVKYLASNAAEGTLPSEKIDIANSTGAILPSTGGIGTTIFYVVGGILVAGAAILLITKKRMSARD